MIDKRNTFFRRLTISMVAFLAALVFLFSVAYKTSDYIRYFSKDLISSNKIEAVALGSSSIINLPLSFFEFCPGLVKRGFSGGTLAHVSSYLDFNFLPNSVKLFIVYIGENDIVYGKSVNETTIKLERLIVNLKTEFRQAKVVIIKIKLAPSRSVHHPKMRALNKKIELMMHNERVGIAGSVLSERSVSQYYLTDGVHLTSEGYRVFLEEVPKKC